MAQADWSCTEAECDEEDGEAMIGGGDTQGGKPDFLFSVLLNL